MVLASLALLTACQAGRAEQPLDMTTLKHDLETVAKARVLFAHQSVGRDILDGVRTLSQRAGVPLRIQQIDGAPPDDKPGLFHLFIGANGEPDGKLEAFMRLVDAQGQAGYDVAALKFCFEDLGSDARGRDGLLDRYTADVRALQARHPGMRIMPVTAPLRADPPGWKTRIKRWLGRSTWEDADNAVRHAYNQGVRERFHEGLFDIAAVESTLPDGSRSSFTANGTTVYTLAQPYTSDGGHLNDDGRLRAAAAFVHAVAENLRLRTH